ncbi:PHP domain-containing protein [Amycolatopsis nigrescens]|uniref:PHP domain-containing protein n=1 Tax=Amycolatopsis nigrescens TaxID=381445 RepID=UPI001B7FD892
MRIDLHAHSTASDGTDSPAELVAAAAGAGLDVVALTDHDTTAGWGPATDALPPGLTLVPGAELSCVADEQGRGISVHLLAYLFDPASAAIVAEQQRLRSERRARLRTMAMRMAADGLPVDPDEIFALLPEDAPAGRPHLAQALVRAGLVKTVDEAFAEYLSNGRGYYVARQDTPVETAIEMITAAGGVTVLAHPYAYSRGWTVSAETIAKMAGHGLTGIEVDHPTHDPAARTELRGLASELGLLRTGSSDYHGTNKTIGLGDETTDPEEFEALAGKASGANVRVG